MEYKQLSGLEEIEDACTADAAAIFYFSSDTCSVCKVLRPKVAEMVEREFPLFRLYYINIDKTPLLGGQYRIFSIPTLLVYFDGKEFFRKSRNISLGELETDLRRPYKLMFDE